MAESEIEKLKKDIKKLKQQQNQLAMTVYSFLTAMDEYDEYEDVIEMEVDSKEFEKYRKLFIEEEGCSDPNYFTNT